MRRRIVCAYVFPLIVSGLLILLGAGKITAMENPALDQEQLNKAIGVHIEKNMPWPSGTMRYEILTSLPEFVLPKSKISWRVDIKGNEYLGDTYFILKLYHKGVLLREETIKVRIEVLHESVVSVRNLGRDSIIGANDVAVQRKWVRSMPLNSISGKDEVVGKLLCVSIRPNAEITRSMLKEVTAVKRGKMVQIVLDSGAISISTVGLSEEDGAEGAFVRVRNVSSNKIIYARVVGESKVKVDFK